VRRELTARRHSRPIVRAPPAWTPDSVGAGAVVSLRDSSYVAERKACVCGETARSH